MGRRIDYPKAESPIRATLWVNRAPDQELEARIGVMRMGRALSETHRRRQIQNAYNREHGITPESIIKSLDEVLGSVYEADYLRVDGEVAETGAKYGGRDELEGEIQALREAMKKAAAKLDFERAAELRDRIRFLEKIDLSA